MKPTNPPISSRIRRMSPKSNAYIGSNTPASARWMDLILLILLQPLRQAKRDDEKKVVDDQSQGSLVKSVRPAIENMIEVPKICFFLQFPEGCCRAVSPRRESDQEWKGARVRQVRNVRG